MSAQPDPVAIALAFAEWGFGVFSVWGIKDGVCLCPKGKDCTDSPGKHPIPRDGFKAATTDPGRITTMLAAAGSAGNYGVFPAENTIIIDVDGLGWKEKLATLGLPKTLAVMTGNGIHLYFHWPESYGPAPTLLFGWKVRSLTHQGYVVGPGSLHQNGSRYRIAHQNGHDIHEMLAKVATFPGALVPQDTKVKVSTQKAPAIGEPVQAITLTGYVLPERVGEGGRYDAIVSYTAHLYNRGFSMEEMWGLVQTQLAPTFEQPLTDVDLRGRFERATAEMAPRLGERAIDRVEPKVDVSAIPVSELFTLIPDYHAQNAATPTYVSPLAAYGTVSLVSGPPKGGKSTLISNLLAARENGTPFLWGDPVPQGPMVLVTEEGGYPVVRKTQGLTTLYVLDRMAFVNHGLSKLDHLIEALDGWAQQQEGPALVVIDTLAVWGDIKDENDAIAATKAVIALRVWAQRTGAAVVLVHHTRKGGGDHGEAIRGSGGIFAAVDQSVELSFTNDPRSDDRGLVIAGRLAFGETKVLAFDRDTSVYSVTTKQPVEKYPTDQFPVDGSGQPGWTNEDAGRVWGMAPNSAYNRLREMVGRGTLVTRDEKEPGARSPHKAYWRAKPLLVLDNRSVGEKMADIFAKGDPE